MSEPFQRRLAAIMFADMVGFTALVEEDEQGAQLLRDRYRQVLVTHVSRFGGRIHQYYGDGALSTFDSAVEAVNCAVELQRELARDPRVSVRIGVHAGDIVHDADGIYGDGVNVAARVEALAPPGGILVSGKVFDEIRNHPSISTVPLGSVRLRNVSHPVALFAVSNDDLPVPSQEAVRAAADARAGEQRDGAAHVAALPSAGAGEAFLRAVRERFLVPWALAYLAAAGIVLAGVRLGADLLGWPAGVVQGADLMAFVGLLVTLVVAWHHGPRGRQPVRRSEVAMVSGLLLAGVVALALVDAGEDATPSRPAPLGEGGPSDSRPAVAVLPFENLSPDVDDAYFAHGVQEDVTNALSRVRSLRVPGRSSVERYRDERPELHQVARILGVDYLLEGTARVAGETVRVTVSLLDGRTGERIWSEQYDRAFTVEGMIDVQADVAREVAERLQALFTPEDSARMLTVPTSVSEAWILFQQARYRWNQRTEADVRAALNLFQAAIDLDPAFAEAHAGLADAYLVMANWGWMDHRVAYPRGIDSARRALELDSLLAGAHASLGGLHLWSSRDWGRSETHFRRALALDSESGYAHYWYSALLGALGRHDEARAQATLAWRLEPLSPQIAYGVARSHFLARDYPAAIAEARKALDLHPGYGNLHSILCSAHVAAGAFEEAEAPCSGPGGGVEEAFRLNLAILRAWQGRRDEAMAEVERVRRAAGAEPQPVIVAMVHAGLGEVDTAIGLLRRAVEEGYPHVEYLSNHPFFDPLQADPRYRQLRDRLGLPAPPNATLDVTVADSWPPRAGAGVEVQAMLTRLRRPGAMPRPAPPGRPR